MSQKPLISVVTPVFNEVEVIALFYDRVRKAMEALDSMAYELIFVDDGSTDGSYEKSSGTRQCERRYQNNQVFAQLRTPNSHYGWNRIWRRAMR